VTLFHLTGNPASDDDAKQVRITPLTPVSVPDVSLDIFWKSVADLPTVIGEASSRPTLDPPALLPNIVTLFGSPPKARMFRFTQRNASI
jgi:hypothetical protein